MKSFIIFLIGSAISAIMGVLDYNEVIAVPNWQDWVPFGIGLCIFIIAHAGAIFFDIIGDVLEALIDGIGK